jgi:hypothetical protein
LLDYVFGPVANFCHLGGLLAGGVYGFVAARGKLQLVRR